MILSAPRNNAPEYNPVAYRADYWIPVRPQSDGALFLGALKIIVDENLHDVDFLKGYTDSPLLIRTDTLQYLDPRDVIKGYQFPDFSKSYSGRVQTLKPSQIQRLGGFMVWDLNKNQVHLPNREHVHFAPIEQLHPVGSGQRRLNAAIQEVPAHLLAVQRDRLVLVQVPHHEPAQPLDQVNRSRTSPCCR